MSWPFNRTKGSFPFIGRFHAGLDITTGAISKLVPAFSTIEFMLTCAILAVLLIIVTRGKLREDSTASPP